MADTRRTKTLKALAIASACDGPPKTPADQQATIEAFVMVLATLHLTTGPFPVGWCKPLSDDIIAFLIDWTAKYKVRAN